jgi:WD40 repeat protein
MPGQWKQSIERPSCSWDYDGQRILGHVGHDICLWDATTGKLLHKMHGHEERIKAVQFSPDGKYALSSSWMGQGGMTMRISRDTSIIVWDLATGRDRHILRGQVAGEFSPDGRRIVSFSQRPGTGIPNPDWGELTLPSTGEVWQNGTSPKFDAAVWDAQTGRQLAEAKLGEQGDPYWDALHFSPDGRSFLLVENGAFLVYNSSAAVLFNTSDGRETGRTGWIKSGGGHRYTSQGALASFGREQAILFDIASGRTIQSIEHGLTRWWGAAWTHDGSKVATIPHDESEIKIWDIKTGKMTAGAKNGPYPHRAAVVSPDNTRLAILWGGADVDNKYVEPGVGIFDMNTGEEIARIELSKLGRMIGFSPDSKTFLVGGAEFVIYNSENGKQIQAVKLLDDDSFARWDE